MTNRTRPTTAPARLAALTLAGTLGLAALAGLAGCAGGGSGAADSAGGAAAGPPAAGRPAADALVSSGARGAPVGPTGAGTSVVTAHTALTGRALIRKGAVELRSGDVEKAREQVVRIADRYAGEVDDEQSATDERGELSYSRLVLRIPSADYGEAFAAVKGAAHLERATSHTEDVTTELIDTTTRLRAERRSIARIEVLFDRADSIRNIIAIEDELAQRQADLQSLERQAAYLRGQTALSTLTVTIDRAASHTPGQRDHHGFLAGLAAGWHSLTGTATALATALGALLPWAVLVAILALPGVPLARVVRRRVSAGRSGRTPSAA